MMRKLVGLLQCLCLVVGLLQGCGDPPDPDIYFAEKTTYMLIGGDPGAADRLDWDTLQFMGTNQGAQFMALPSEGEKIGFKNPFINSVSAAFQAMKLDVNSLNNWRISTKGTWQTVVIADTPTQSKVLVTVSRRTGQPLISAINRVT